MPVLRVRHGPARVSVGRCFADVQDGAGSLPTLGQKLGAFPGPSPAHTPSHSSVSLLSRPPLSLSHGVVCLRGAPRSPCGTAPWISCLSVCPSLFPGVFCHRTPPRLICPCSNWPPAARSIPHSVSPPPTAPRDPALPPRTPARPLAHPPCGSSSLFPIARRLCRRPPPAHLPARRVLMLSGPHVAAQRPVRPARKVSGACSGRPWRTWSRVASRSC